MDLAQHMLFADDCVIFINANCASPRRLEEIIQIYDEASVQRVNKGKIAIFLVHVHLMII
jgi:hypothetical protein